MKKLFTLIALALGFTASASAAQLYVCGDAPIGNGWGTVEANQVPMTLAQDGITNSITVELTGDKWFCITTGWTEAEDWTTFNNADSKLRYAYNGDVAEGEYQMEAGEKTSKLSAGKWNISVNSETMKMTITKAGEANITIEQVEIRGSFNGWAESEQSKMTKGEGNVYTLNVDLSETTADEQFKLVVNGSWMAFGAQTIDAPEGWIVDGGGNDHNNKLMNSTTGYKTYKFTATWEQNNENATKGWTLKIEGIDKRGDEPAPEAVYTVAGSFTKSKEGAQPEARFFGTAWAADLAENDMVKGEGDVYTKTFSGVSLEPGTILYKVVKNHGWTDAWGMDKADGNAEFVITESASYNITFKFNPNGKFENDWNVDCVVENVGEYTAISSVATNRPAQVIYNLAGQQVKKAQKGLYIINGRKVVK